MNNKTPGHEGTTDSETRLLEETGSLKRSPGGIPYLDWGGQGPVIHFAHANGFPPGTYSSFVARLTDQFRVLGWEGRALWGTHDSGTPCHSAKSAERSSGERRADYRERGTDADGGQPARFHHWRELADDLARFLGELNLHGIIGAGHSLGAVTSLFCAVANPGLFRALVLIDPVIVPAQMAPVVAVAVHLGLSSRNRFPAGARQRRTEWPDREVLFRAYRAAPIFARWQERFLRDYVFHGTVENPAGGVRLRYPREWEARIFETVPADVWLDIPRLRHMPLLVLRGEHSTTYRSDTMRLMRWLLPQGKFVEIAGADHFVPMSQPEATAAAIRAFLKE